MTEYIFAIDRKVMSPNGVHSLVFRAGVPRDVPAHMERYVVAAGGFPAKEAPTPREMEDVKAESVPEPEPNEDGAAEEAKVDGGLEEIVKVMKAILAEDRAELLTAAGIPRANEIEARLGWDTSKEQREAAWALVE